MYAKKNSGKKILAMALAVVLLIGVGVGGTLAWLQDETDPVINTFTVGNIEINLNEHTLDERGNLTEVLTKENKTDYKILPGAEQNKDPFVTVVAGSEACWLFIEIEEQNNYLFTTDDNGKKTYQFGDGATKFVEWEIDDTTDGNGNKWELHATTPNKDNGTFTYVYHRTQPAVTEDTIIPVLKDNKVSYSPDLTKENIDLLYTFETDNKGNVTKMTKTEDQPALKFTAYAVQQVDGEGRDFSANDAWNIIQGIPLTPPDED